MGGHPERPNIHYNAGLCQIGYISGYIDYDEALSYGQGFAIELCKHYNNWEEVYSGYDAQLKEANGANSDSIMSHFNKLEEQYSSLLDNSLFDDSLNEQINAAEPILTRMQKWNVYELDTGESIPSLYSVVGERELIHYDNYSASDAKIYADDLVSNEGFVITEAIEEENIYIMERESQLGILKVTISAGENGFAILLEDSTDAD